MRAAGRVCALPAAAVAEVLRPLPVEALGAGPDWLLGLSMIRGNPTPVVALDRLLGSPPGAPARLVMLRAGGRRAALAVDAVLGLRDLHGERIGPLPPLLPRDRLEALGTLDGELLLVLRAAALVPPEAWRALERAGKAGA